MIGTLVAALLLAPAAQIGIPRLEWVPRSDWINVRRDATPRAVGDGVADDTAALQAGLDALSDRAGGRNTLYLPAGTYRITRTLALHKRDGIALIGCGRATRIVWDGPGGTGDDSRMFWSEGTPRSRYVGIVWDGRNRAFTGFDHDSHSLFETEIDHQHEAFVNCTGSGFRVGHDQARPGSLATAETTIRNCLFRNCERGVALLQFNDYDFTLAGCQFEDCGTAFYGSKGCNFYVRDCAFRRSRAVDVLVGAEHACSIRRSTSAGSRMFLQHDCIAPLTIEGCRVDAWTHPDAAVTLNWGPALIFDTAFTHPPGRNPPIRPANGQRIVLSAVESAGTEGVLQATGARVSRIPPDARRALGTPLPPARTFLTDRAELPRVVLDARRDFGAKGDGRADDTAAVQRAIDAARKRGHGAMAYLPSGDYVITRTLVLAGRDYVVGGSGTHTRLFWRGQEGGTLLHVTSPVGIMLENMDAGASGDQQNGVDILQTGPGTARYERVWVFGMYAKQPLRKGFVARGLPAGATLVGEHVTGNLRFTDCSRARILMNSSYEGAITVEGREPVRDGILGFLTRLGTINLCGLYVRDSQSIVMSDYYVEQADRFMDFRGRPGDPPGRVTISMPKDHGTQNPVISIAGYHGRVAIGPSMPYPGSVSPMQVIQQGDNPFSLVWMASQAYNVPVEFHLASAARLALIGNSGAMDTPDRIPAGGLADAASALADLRRLGRLDLALNYTSVAPSPRVQIGIVRVAGKKE
jgi:hypothetical protein